MPAGPDTNSVRPLAGARSGDHPVDAVEYSVATQRRPRGQPDTPVVRHVLGKQRRTQRGDRRSWGDTEVAAQRALQPLQLAQRPAPVAALGEPAGQRDARLLVGGVGAHEIRPPARAAQHLLVQPVQPISRAVQPRLIRVAG
jgi:hypothetical protein